MKRLQPIIKFFASPLTLGIIATIGFSYVSWQFLIFKNLGNIDGANPVYRLLWDFHQKSIDWRLQMRGPRPGTDQVALLAVDEKAVQSIGRWPWPREYIAELINRSVDLGAKAVGFDAVFSEPSATPAQDLFSKIKSHVNVP